MVIPPDALGMLTERPGSSKDTTRGPKDLTGKSIKEKRVRMIHSRDSSLLGTSLYFQEKDPWLAYQRGKNLFLREFRMRDGVFGQAGAFFGKLSSDRMAPLIDRDHASSCGTCHNIPYREAGAGITMPKNGGEGRNTPHLFGGGLIEMIGLQTRLKVLEICDPDHQGFVPKNKVPDREVLIVPSPGEPPIHYGKCGDMNGDGRPDLNKIFRIWYVDKYGKRVFEDQNGDGLVDLRDPNVAGYNFEVHVYGWGEVPAGMTSTLRSFFTEPSDTHAGMQSYDPTTNEDDGSGLARVSNPGAQQFALHASPDRGLQKTALGISLDDPDGDGFLNEVSEGDLDMAEWFMLNAPPPGMGIQTPRTQRGKNLFVQWKCASCHTPDWKLEAADSGNANPYRRYDGDRRFFDFRVFYNEKKGREEGKLIPLFHKEGDRFVPDRRAYFIRGIYSDFKHHDVGPDFYQTQFDGSEVRQFRTAPLWGVGTTAPYGHDGKSFTLDEVIRRHGGEADLSAKRYRSAPATDQEALIAFLNSMVLYQSDNLPSDLKGTGVVDDHFIVAGKDTGLERFNPEYLFNHPCEIEGPANRPNGDPMVSYACVNISEAYQDELPFIRDQDNDGFPDLSDPCPTVTGYMDGCRSTLSPIGPSLKMERVSQKAEVSVGGPEGGIVNIIMFDPQNPGTLYVGLDGGGIFKSVDGGSSWNPYNTGLDGRDVMAMAINPANPKILYVGTGTGVFRSSNEGLSWESVNNGMGKEVIMGLTIHPRAPNILYAGTMTSLFKTVDGGDHWTKLQMGLPHHAHVHGLILDAGMATTPSLNQRPYDILYVALEGYGVFKSLNGGVNWVEINNGLENRYIRGLAQNPQVPSIVYALNGSKGVYITRDQGEHWKLMENALANLPVSDFLVNPLNPKILYAAVEGNGLYRSSDSGQKWEPILISTIHSGPICLAVHPWSPSSIFVGTGREGIFHSADGGDHWNKVTTGMTHFEVTAFLADPVNPEIYYLGGQLGLYVSRNGGVSWEKASTGGKTLRVATLVFDSLTKKVYAGTPVETFSTLDHGKTWEVGSPGPPEAASLYFIFRNSKVDYLGGFGGIFKRTPQDMKWIKINGKEFDYPQILSIAIDPENPFHLYIGSEKGIFESKDAGEKWESLNQGIGNIKIRNLIIHPKNPKMIFAATEKGFFKSSDGGSHWNQPSSNLRSSVTSLYSNPANPKILVIKTLEGVYASEDEGDHWSLKELDTHFLPLAINASGDVLIGTEQTGLLKIPLP